jgi:transposase-like protein
VSRGRRHGQCLRRARRRRQPRRLHESLALDVVTAKDGAAWLAFPRSLPARGLSGVRLVSSDAHPGLVDAIAATLAGASWQRCRTHFMRNLLTPVPKSAQTFVATMVRTIFAQPDAETVHEQQRRIVDQLETRFPQAPAPARRGGRRSARLHRLPEGALAPSLEQQLARTAQQEDPPPHRRHRDLPDRAAVNRLAAAVLAEQHDE